MKKKSIFIIMLMACVILSACGNSSTTVDNAENISESEENMEISEEDMKNSYYDLAKKQYADKEYISAVNTIDLGCNGYDPDGIKEKAQIEIEKIRSYASAVSLLSNEDVVFINEKQTLSVAGKSEYISTLDWSDLKQIELIGFRMLGLKNDGTVEVSDYYWESELLSGNKPDFLNEVKSWSDIVNLAVITDIGEQYIFGLKTDGTVVVAGEGEKKNQFESVQTWTNVKRIIGKNTTYGLYGVTEDGNLLYTSDYTFRDVSNIIDLDSDSFSLLVTSDSIAARGLLFDTPEDINYQNIVDVEVGHHYAAFLYDSGKVKFWNLDTDEICDVHGVDNVVAICGTSNFFVAYKCNNEVAIIGNTERTDVVSEPGIDVIDMELNSINRNPINVTNNATAPKEYEPTIGMTKEEVVSSNWGEPKKKNITEAYWGTHEQWVYSLDRYVYFENGIVTAIQKSE